MDTSANGRNKAEVAGPSGRLTQHPSFEYTDEMDAQPVVCLIIGMAGSGKSTLMYQLIRQLYQQSEKPYVINLDPAVVKVPYESAMNVDIRDTVKYKSVMQDYNLGPNGAIMTCLNLYCTRFDQVLHFLESRVKPIGNLGESSVPKKATAPSTAEQPSSAAVFRHVLVDTPGQIEAFTWSASGTIITDALATTFPTIVIYVVDTPRCAENVLTFSSNMLHACSIMYKTRLPMVVVFNKNDVVPADGPIEWMNDYLAFDEHVGTASSYAATFARSMAMALNEFYKHIKTVQVSALDGGGFNDLIDAINIAKQGYFRTYAPQLQKKRKHAEKKKISKDEQELERFRRDFEERRSGQNSTESSNPKASSSLSETAEHKLAKDLQESLKM